MRRELFLRIVNGLSARYPDFQQRWDAAGKPGLSPLQKCTTAIRQLAYGGCADMFDEYLHVADTTGRDCLKKFCKGVIETFGPTYLRKPTVQDCQFLLDLHWRTHGFPGMLGSIDCMHWQWKNCPTAWRGQFTSGYKGTHPTIILEAVADQRLWIWHAYFGVAGSNNDLNVLQSSPLFNDQCQGIGPLVNFTANGNQYQMGYYLADGIYPKWPVFVKTISCPTEEKRSYFAQRQEAARKDVERAFGVLQSRFALVKGPARFFYKGDLTDIIYAAIVLHNMIVESDDEDVTDVPVEDIAGSSHGVARESHRQGVPHGFADRLRAFVDMRQKEAHNRLQHDMVEEIWGQRGRR
ncbi:uncharacterized protein LOC125199069 [Salvia hispanica]|uniref:uncharacterized protein LOC125199069 n=1 Tax=Salvia hispanica TaxID=49212 RepID=UPI002009AD28|nr:uncharacterized protein LOC125199069 [Salvia hispanica]